MVIIHQTLKLVSILPFARHHSGPTYTLLAVTLECKDSHKTPIPERPIGTFAEGPLTDPTGSTMTEPQS